MSKPKNQEHEKIKHKIGEIEPLGNKEILFYLAMLAIWFYTCYQLASFAHTFMELQGKTVEDAQVVATSEEEMELFQNMAREIDPTFDLIIRQRYNGFITAQYDTSLLQALELNRQIFNYFREASNTAIGYELMAEDGTISVDIEKISYALEHNMIDSNNIINPRLVSLLSLTELRTENFLSDDEYNALFQNAGNQVRQNYTDPRGYLPDLRTTALVNSLQGMDIVTRGLVEANYHDFLKISWMDLASYLAAAGISFFTLFRFLMNADNIEAMYLLFSRRKEEDEVKTEDPNTSRLRLPSTNAEEEMDVYTDSEELRKEVK